MYIFCAIPKKVANIVRSNGVERRAGEVDDAGDGASDDSDEAFADARSESAYTALTGAFDRLEEDAGYTVEDALTETFDASHHSLTEVLRAAIKRLLTLTLIFAVEGKGGHTLAQRACNSRYRTRGAA